MLNSPPVTLTNRREYGSKSIFRTSEKPKTLVYETFAAAIYASHDNYFVRLNLNNSQAIK